MSILTFTYRPIFYTICSNVRQRATIKATSSVGIVRYFQASRKVFEQCADAESDLLHAQRKLRPCSPHLTIYQPQLTWYMSSAHRITGCAMGGALYLGAMAYLAGPVFGYSVDANTVVSSFGAAPEAVKMSAKAILALPFTFHASNGIRHLVWDAGKCLDIKGVYNTGYVVLASTVIGTAYLATM
ncbi:succinate dehydrogenase flavoprotein subunit 3 SDH3 [Mucor lusitanicus]|uniref:Succinate dehydrogenase flavo protein subunit 3 SDH3 n=2 Tax=Mucor circinelloides f. lusitanicus TaxID=29924 RepID=A0A162TK11_MUCCL|nr:succinate dehydrogenase flavo protein subunit 3 SDH3 [Mucor lusitanicus]OAD05152.1 succinate dehydrogenase flavo protein subunit 3 SDH3 [Mucor lusitanicus CBS 277.49]